MRIVVEIPEAPPSPRTLSSSRERSDERGDGRPRPSRSAAPRFGWSMLLPLPIATYGAGCLGQYTPRVDESNDYRQAAR